MRKTIFVIGFATVALGFMGCGPSAAETEKLTTEINQLETNTTQLDSTSAEVKKTSAELADVLNQLEAQ